MIAIKISTNLVAIIYITEKNTQMEMVKMLFKQIVSDDHELVILAKRLIIVSLI
jgi:hypothetical protein